MGVAYKKSGRTRPIMDELSFHPFPSLNTDPLLKGYLWPNAGISNLDRVKQAVWDAFNATGQPVFPETAYGAGTVGGGSLRFRLNEVGWQVAIVPSAIGAYFGREVGATTDEATQAQIYAAAIPFVACDPAVHSLLFFHLVDEPDLDRWQSGLIRADGSPRPSYAAVKDAIARTGGRCQGIQTAWRHATAVIGPSARFSPKMRRSASDKAWALVTTALEDATYTAGVFRVAGAKPLTARARAALGRALLRSRPRGASLSTRGKVKAYRETVARFPARRLKPGRYVFAIQLYAELNPLRRALFVSKPFQVAAPKRRR
jgi:hypothetical protein